MSRVFNFSAGPAVLPESVLAEAAAEMMDYKGTGMSVMEMSHRSKAYQQIIDEAEADLRTLMNIPDNYKVLFLQGGASQQFAAIPMNLMKNGVADYIITGQWAKKAYEEAKKYGKANAVAFCAVGFVPLVELIEDLAQFLLRNLGSLVADRNFQCMGLLLNRHRHRAVLRRKFDGIGDYIIPYVMEKAFVSRIFESLKLRVKLDIFLFPGRLKHNDRLPYLLVKAIANLALRNRLVFDL